MSKRSGGGQRGMISAGTREVNRMTSQQSETKTRSKRSQLGTVTCTNRPDPWKVREALAHAAEEMFGCKITVTSVRYKDTGEEVPRREPSAVETGAGA